MDSKQLVYFKETINLIKQKNIPTYLVIAPYTNAPLNMNEYVDFLERNTEIMVLDYSKFFCDNPNDYFFDRGHLNFKGATIFTEEVLDQINKLEQVRLAGNASPDGV